MDFFEAQERAKQRTTWLVVLFAFAVLGTIAAAYAAALLIVSTVGERPDTAFGAPAVALWQPTLFAAVTVGTIAIVGLASLFKWSQVSSGGRVVAENLGGRPVDGSTANFDERRLLNVVEEMAIASGTPVPAVYVLDDEAGLNAFAAGLTTSDAVIAVTRGTLEKLTRDELQGVVGHEFSHILNGDMRLNMRLMALLFGILVLGLAGRGILGSFRHVRTGRSRNKNGGGVLVAIAATGVALFIVGYVGYFFGRLVQSAVSRQREFLADASAVQFTRNPGGIAGALKKIGGYAIGSALSSTKSTEIGHFFFAQGFRASLGGLWATHPPLIERIRAIEPAFDGKLFQPPQIVDVAHQSFASAAVGRLTPSRPSAPAAPGAASDALTPDAATAAVESIGSLTAAQIEHAHGLLEAIPARLRDAAHHSDEARLVLFGLLLSDKPRTRDVQRRIIRDRSSTDFVRLKDDLEPALVGLSPELRLPLLQLCLPALRQYPAVSLDEFLEMLDELVHADAHVSTFEFVLQKLLVHTLELGRDPGSAGVRYHSFYAVVDEIAIVLSVLARASTSNTELARAAFNAGAVHLNMNEPRLRFLAPLACSLVNLDAALDKLAGATLPIKQRTLVAASHVVSADGRILLAEAELLRAVSAALDCPMPALTPA